MLDRGLRRRFDPAVDVERATGARRRPRGADPDVARRDLTGCTTFTIDPVTARDFDDAICAERPRRRRRPRLGAHRRRQRVRRAGLARRPRGGAARRRASTSPGASSRCCPRRCPTTPARSCPATGAAVTVELDFAARGRRAGVVLPLDDPLRRAPGLRARRPDLRRRGARRRAVGEPLGPRATSPRRCTSAALAQARARARDSRAGVPLRRRRPRRAVAAERADRVAPAHRAPHDRGERAGRAAARRSAAVPTLYRVHEQPDGESALRLVEQLASLGVADAARPRAHDAGGGGRASIAACSRLVDAARRARPATGATR